MYTTQRKFEVFKFTASFFDGKGIPVSFNQRDNDTDIKIVSLQLTGLNP